LRLQLDDSPAQLCRVALDELLDLAARPPAVAPQAEQRADILDRKAEPARFAASPMFTASSMMMVRVHHGVAAAPGDQPPVDWKGRHCRDCEGNGKARPEQQAG
jgi:hypothetical protein